MNKLSNYDKLAILLTTVCLCLFANNYYHKKIQPNMQQQNEIVNTESDLKKDNDNYDCDKPCLERPLKCKKTEIDGLPVTRLSGYVNNLRTTNADGIYAQLYNQYDCSFSKQKHYIWDESSEKFIELDGTHHVTKDDNRASKTFKNEEILYKGEIYKIQNQHNLVNDNSKIIFPK